MGTVVEERITPGGNWSPDRNPNRCSHLHIWNVSVNVYTYYRVMESNVRWRGPWEAIVFAGWETSTPFFSRNRVLSCQIVPLNFV